MELRFKVSYTHRAGDGEHFILEPNENGEVTVEVDEALYRRLPIRLENVVYMGLFQRQKGSRTDSKETKE